MRLLKLLKQCKEKRYDYAANAIIAGLFGLGLFVATIVLALLTPLNWVVVLILECLVGLAVLDYMKGSLRNFYAKARERLAKKKEKQDSDKAPVDDDPMPVEPVDPGLPPAYDKLRHPLYFYEIAAVAVLLIIGLEFVSTDASVRVRLILLIFAGLVVLRQWLMWTWRPIHCDPEENILIVHQRGLWLLVMSTSTRNQYPLEQFKLDTVRQTPIEFIFRLKSQTLLIEDRKGAEQPRRLRRVYNVEDILDIQLRRAKYDLYLQRMQAYGPQLIAWQDRQERKAIIQKEAQQKSLETTE